MYQCDVQFGRNQPQTQASQLVPGTTPSRSTPKLPQLALPPPPGSTKKPLGTSVRTVFGSSSTRSSPVDLLSGDFIANQSPATGAPPASAPVDQNQAQLDLLALPAPEGPPNPFGSTSFQATPSNPPPPSYGGSLQSQLPQIHVPEYQQQQLGRTQSQPVGNSYAAPWSQAAIAAGNTLSAQQRAAIYGEVHSSSPQSPTGQQQPQGQPTQYFSQSQSTVTTPPPWQEDPQPQAQQQPWTGGYQAPYPSWGGANGPQPWNPQQQPARSYSLPWTAESGTATFPNQSNQIQQYQQSQVGQGPGDNFGSQYLHQRGSQYGQPSTAGASQPQGVPSKSVKPSDMLFDDLVDLRSVNAKLKATGIHGNISRSNTSKAGPWFDISILAAYRLGWWGAWSSISLHIALFIFLPLTSLSSLWRSDKPVTPSCILEVVSPAFKKVQCKCFRLLLWGDSVQKSKSFFSTCDLSEIGVGQYPGCLQCTT